MNIFKFEMKSAAKFSLSWTISLILVLLVFMLGIYPVFGDSLDEVTKVLSGFPPEFSAAFGFEIADLFSFEGFYSFAFGYISLMGSIMAVSLSLSSFSREKRSKCTDFLLTKPVSREWIFISKLLAGILLLAAACAAYTLSLAWISCQVPSVSPGLFSAVGPGLFFTQLVFFAVGILYSVCCKRIRSISGTATAFGFAAFILSALVNIMQVKNLTFAAPLKYFDPYTFFQSGSYDFRYGLTAFILVITCSTLAFVRFCRSDS